MPTRDILDKDLIRQFHHRHPDQPSRNRVRGLTKQASVTGRGNADTFEENSAEEDEESSISPPPKSQEDSASEEY